MKPLRLIILLAAIAATAAAGRPAFGVTLETVGEAPADLPNAREAAIEDALRRAVEIGGGVELASLSETRDFVLVRDVIFTKTAGLVEHYEVLLENPDQDGAYAVKVRSTISRGSLDSSIAAWKSLLKRKGRPRMMVVGSVDRRPFERRLTAELQGMMERRGLTVIDLEMLNEKARADAERAARGDLDPKLAALIAREAGADYFLIASVEGAQHSSQSYGIDLFRVDATAILKVVAADTAQVIASEVRTVSSGARDLPAATRQATSGAIREAFEAVVGRIGANWLEDVDQRGGAEVTLIIGKCPFDRLNQLCRRLRQQPAIKDVIVDASDAEGRSFLRVITNDTAADVGAFVLKADPGLSIRSTSKGQIELIAAGAAPTSASAPAPAVASRTPAAPAASPPAGARPRWRVDLKPVLIGAAVGAASVILLLAIGKLFQKS